MAAPRTVREAREYMLALAALIEAGLKRPPLLLSLRCNKDQFRTPPPAGSRPVYGSLLRFVGNESHAEDLLSEISSTCGVRLVEIPLRLIASKSVVGRSHHRPEGLARLY